MVKTKTETPLGADEVNAISDPLACGYINAHWQGTTEMRCTLPKGHTGNHSAPYKRFNGTTETYEKAGASWSDDAGVPLDVIADMLAVEKAAEKPAPPSIFSRLSKTEIAQMRKLDIGV